MTFPGDSKSNLNNIDNVYVEVEEYYKMNIKYFSEMEKILLDDFCIPRNVAADTIKHYLVATVNGGVNSFFLYPKKLKSNIIYLIAGAFLLLMTVVGARSKKIINCDIVFDNCFSRNFDINYQVIYDRLSSYKIKILQTFRTGQSRYVDFKQKLETSSEDLQEHHISAYAKYTNYYAANVSLKIFISVCKHFIQYRTLTNTMNFDFLQLAIRIYKSIAIYETDVNVIRSKILVTFDDNGYGALRYFIYKKKIGTIMAIQNGYRFGYQSNRMGDMYLYSDYYFGFGKNNIDIQKGMVSGNKLGVGSLRLQNALVNYKDMAPLDFQYDVLFLEQLSEVDLPAFRLETYMQCISLLCEFAIRNPHYRVAYRARVDRADLHFFGQRTQQSAKKIDEMLEKANVILSYNMKKNSYVEILKSKVILFYTSTLGFESIGMNKRVINLNLNKLSMGLSLEDDIGTLVENNYSLFDQKLLFLINGTGCEIDKFYCSIKKKYMDVEKNIVDTIVNAIEYECRINL
jgi:surface carbohydrate biosynthesis protein